MKNWQDSDNKDRYNQIGSTTPIRPLRAYMLHLNYFLGIIALVKATDRLIGRLSLGLRNGDTFESMELNYICQPNIC